jgi:hypothetical protein
MANRASVNLTSYGVVGSVAESRGNYTHVAPPSSPDPGIFTQNDPALHGPVIEPFVPPGVEPAERD